jgi:hypothetical protein
VFLNYPCIPIPSISPDNWEYTTIVFESPKRPSDEKCLGPMSLLIGSWYKVKVLYTSRITHYVVRMVSTYTISYWLATKRQVKEGCWSKLIQTVSKMLDYTHYLIRDIAQPVVLITNTLKLQFYKNSILSVDFRFRQCPLHFAR